jgi:hypothetical protein
LIGIRGFLFAFVTHGRDEHHEMHIRRGAKVLNSLSAHQRRELEVDDRWDEDETYDRLDRTFNVVAKALERGHLDENGVTIDAQYFVDRLVAASIPDDLPTSSSVAVDGTDLETCPGLHPHQGQHAPRVHTCGSQPVSSRVVP